MSRHIDAEKQQRQNLKHRARNRNLKERLKNALRSGREAALKLDAKGVAATIKEIGRMGSAGVIHKRKASRLASRMALAQNRAKAGGPVVEAKTGKGKAKAPKAKAPKAAKPAKA